LFVFGEREGCTDEAEYGDSVVHITSRDWQLRWEEEEDSSEKCKCQPSLIVSSAKTGGDGHTILQMGPRIGPRVKVGSGSEGGRRIFRPLMTTSRTNHQQHLIKRDGMDLLGIEYEIFKNTTELDKIAFKAELEPR
jgi:hypothetical protein